MGRAEDLFKRLSVTGQREIDGLIQDRQSEELFLDFKRSADAGSGNRLHDNDRTNFAKAISGFGNSEGGVILWGVDCRNQADRGDVASTKFPIQDPTRFLSWLEGAISGCTMPSHPMIRQIAIEIPSTNTGFVATYIAKSHLAPHQSLRHTQYFIRAGSDFVPTPHAVLAGLFGRRPQPFVFHCWGHTPVNLAAGRAAFDIDFVLASRGPGLARDLYVNMLLSGPSGGTEIFVQPNEADWTIRRPDDLRTCLVSKDQVKLSPAAKLVAIKLKYYVEPPFESPNFYKFTFGHEGSPVRSVEATVEPEALQLAYDRLVANQGVGSSGHEFVNVIMGLSENGEGGQEFYGDPVYEA